MKTDQSQCRACGCKSETDPCKRCERWLNAPDFRRGRPMRVYPFSGKLRLFKPLPVKREQE